MRRLLTISLILSLFALPALGAIPPAESPRLIVGGDHDNPPYEFLENGKPTGFNIELIRAVADVMGLNVDIRLGPWNQVRHDLEKGKVDMLAGMYYSEERSRLVDFSVPHTMVSSGIFLRNDSPIRSVTDIKGKEIIVQKGDIVNDLLKKDGLTSRIIAVTNPEDELRLLATGKHDCALMPSRLQGEYFAKKLGLTKIRAINSDLPQLRYCFAVRKGNRALLYRLDEGLNILKVNGTYRQIYEKWFGVYEKRDLWQTLRYFVWALAVIAALLAANFIWSWSLRRVVRKRTAELRESEEKFRVLTETSPSGIWLYQGERIVYVNPATTRLLEYTEDECLGMKFWNWVHEDFRELVRERGMARQQGKPVPSQYECKHVTKSGKEKWALVSAGLIEYRGKPAGIVTMFDITDRKRMEEDLQHAYDDLEKRVEERTVELAETVAALTESEGTQRKLAAELDRKRNFLRTLIDSIPDLIFYKDPESVYLGCNKAFEAYAGHSERELIGHTDIDFFPQELARLYREMDRKMLSGGVARRNEEWIDYPDGRRVYLETLKTPYHDHEGKVIGLIGVSRDITGRKLVEERLKRKREQLEELNRTLEKRVSEEVAKNREKDILLIQQNRQAALGELLDHIAHQWKQPLNVINLVTYDLGESFTRGSLTNEHVTSTVDKIMALTQHMAQTIDVFRDFYKPEKEKIIFRVKEPIDKAVSFVAPVLKFHSIALELEVDPELSAIGYPKEFAQVLLNILGNARDVFKERGVEKPLLKIRAFADGKDAVVTITDNAGGIPESLIAKVFDIYFTTKQGSGGTGIGLHMSKNIIEKNMEGRLSVVNVDQGAQFRIEVQMPE